MFGLSLEEQDFLSLLVPFLPISPKPLCVCVCVWRAMPLGKREERVRYLIRRVTCGTCILGRLQMSARGNVFGLRMPLL